MTPIRIQRRRTKGWRMPEGAVYVGRPSAWGNPFPIEGDWIAAACYAYGYADTETYPASGAWRRAMAVALYREWLTGDPIMPSLATIGISQPVEFTFGSIGGRAWLFDTGVIDLPHKPPLNVLRGKDLVCWCPLDQPCHADVLLELANR